MELKEEVKMDLPASDALALRQACAPRLAIVSVISAKLKS